MKNKHMSKTLLTLVMITTISGFVLMSSGASAEDSVVDQVSVTVPVSCSFIGMGQDSHNAEIANGVYRENIGTTNMQVLCNDNEGFAIYAVGYTGNTIGEANSNRLVGTAASGNATIESGIATAAGASDVSNWAMKLTSVQDSGDTTGANAFMIDSAPNVVGGADASFSEYHTVPNEYTKVAHKNSSTDMSATQGVKLAATYAAYISKTQVADTYSGQVKYVLVHPSSHPAPIACNPRGTTIGVDDETDIVCLQDFAAMDSETKASLTESMNVGTQYTLIDGRDEKSYTISKLADNKVWMTKNLDLDLNAGATYTNKDTDLGWNAATESYETASWSPMRSTYGTASSNIHQWCQGGTWDEGICRDNNTPESYDPGDLYWNGMTSDGSDWLSYYGSCDYSTSTPVCNESLNPIANYVVTSGAVTPQRHLGNFYNWAAAVASNDAGVYGESNPEANQSICPAGWTLPQGKYNSATGQETGDFANLWSAYGWDSSSGFSDVSTLWSSPLNFVPSGYFGGNLGNTGNDDFLWLGMTYYDNSAGIAYFYVDGIVNPADYDGQRESGNTIRCRLR